MRITTAWFQEDGSNDSPWMLTAYCSNTEDCWQGVPDWYKNEIDNVNGQGQIRVVVLEIPDDAVYSLFAPASAVAKIAS